MVRDSCTLVAQKLNTSPLTPLIKCWNVKLSSKRKSLTSILSHTHAQIINLQRALCQGRWSWTMALVKWSYTGGKKETQHFIKADKSDWGLLQKVPIKLVFVERYINEWGKNRKWTGHISNALEQADETDFNFLLWLFYQCTSRLTSIVEAWGEVRGVGATECLGLAGFEVSCSFVSFKCCPCLLFVGESAGWGVCFCVPARREGNSESESSEILWIWNNNKNHILII